MITLAFIAGAAVIAGCAWLERINGGPVAVRDVARVARQGWRR